MVSATDIAHEQDAGLQLLFQRGLELALKIQDDAMAAETADERARLGAAFHRISRGVRQTAALRAKLAGDAQRCEREAAAEVLSLETARVTRRKAQVKATVERLIWTETETQEREDHLCDLLETFLDEDDLHGRLADGDIDAHIARICGEIGLPLALPIHGEGGPSAERSEERMVGGASQAHCAPLAPSTTPSAGRGPPPPGMGEAEDWRSSA